MFGVNCKKIIITALIIVIGYFAIKFIWHFQYYYGSVFFDYKHDFWLFQDSIKTHIDTTSGSGWVRKTDRIQSYWYTNKKKEFYVISVWEIKSLHNVDLKSIKFNEDYPLINYKYEPGQLLDSGSSHETYVKFGSFFKDTINIDLDDASKIYKKIESEHYRGFYGLVKRMAFENEERDYLVIETFPWHIQKMLFLLYKANDSFYIIEISADVPFDENVISFLQLK
jgi:hypothetical protein